MPKNYKLIFALTHNNLFGFLVEAYRIILLKNGQWSMEIKRICDPDSQFLTVETTEKEKEILEMTFELREDKVLEKFHLLKEKKVQTNGTFYTDTNISKHMVPYVSARTATLINEFADFKIPLYFKSGESFSTFGDDFLEIQEDVAEPRFWFSLNDTGFQYKLSVFFKEEQIPLIDTEIITQKPCFIKFNNKIIPLPDDFDGQLIKPFIKQEQIDIPKDKVKTYLQTFVSKIIRKYRAEVIGFSIEELSPGVKPVFAINKLQKKNPVIELLFNYDGEQFLASSSQDFSLKLVSSDNKILFIKTFRNRNAENEIIKSFELLGFKMIQPGYFTCAFHENEERFVTIQHLLAELSAKSVSLKEMGAEFDITVDSKRYIIEEPNLVTSIDGVNDWFDLKMNIEFNGFTVPFQKIIPNIIKGDNEFKLPDGTIAILPVEWFSRFKDVAVLSEQGEQGLKIHKSQISLIENLQDNIPTQLSEKLINLVKREIPSIPVPLSLKATLRDYQKKGCDWLCYLHECGLGGCLADDMGLGKTIQVLTYFLSLIEKPQIAFDDTLKACNETKFLEQNSERRAHTHLIVCPLSLVYNWQEEIQKFAPSLKTVIYSGPDRYRMYHDFAYADVILTSYGIIRNDSDVLKHFDFHTIVLDESQFIKNPDSKSYDSLLLLNSKQRFVLSGTPLENSLIDIWTQMNFLNPGMLGPLKTFRDTYVIPIEKNHDEQVSKRVQKMIGPFIMRRTKSEVAPELPALTEKICYCSMTEEQNSLYEKKKSEIRNYLIENSTSLTKNRRNIIVLSGLMKLRLIASHPLMSDASFDGKSGKFDQICQYLEKAVAEGNKTIIFSQFVKHLNLVKAYLEERKIPYEMLTGKTSQADRNKNIKNFQNNDEVRLFLMTLKAGGVGLNLTQADYVFVLDPWWNPATEMQAINRAHRIGQDKKVFAYKFISTQTIEEKIVLLQKKKSVLFENFINSSSLGKLTEEELMTLFE